MQYVYESSATTSVVLAMGTYVVTSYKPSSSLTPNQGKKKVFHAHASEFFSPLFKSQTYD